MSENNVIDMIKDINIVGPELTGNVVIVDERIIPKMRCYDRGENVEIILDRRFSYTFPKKLAYLAAAFAAQAMAIGEGYPHLGADNKERPFAPQVLMIEGAE